MKQQIKSGMIFDTRSDHLIAMVKYCYDLAVTSNVPVLDYGDNENALDVDEQKEYIAELLQLLKKQTADGNQDLLIVADKDMVERYWQQY